MEHTQIRWGLPSGHLGSAVTRSEYEVLLLDAARQIHLLACCEALDVPDWSTRHRDAVGGSMGAHAGFQVNFDHLGLRVPPEEQALPLSNLRRQAVTPGGRCR